MHVCVDCDPHAAPSLLDNVITDNQTTSDEPNGDAGGIGAAFLGNFVTNQLHGNTRGGEPSDFGWFNLAAEDWPDWVAAPVLRDVWWGTDDEAQIAEAVWDGADDDRYGQVALEEVRAEPIPGAIPRVVIASRRQEYSVAGEEISVFLTLYNPGEAAAFRLDIQVNGAPFSGELTYPGATQDGEPWVLDLPDNAVWFGTLETSTWDGATAQDLSWEATLMGADGAVIGVTTAARYLTGADL